MLHENSRETTFQHQRVPAARLKVFLIDMLHIATLIQVDLKSFLASGAFFLGREANERAVTTS